MLRQVFSSLLVLAAASACAWCTETLTPKSYVLGPDDQISVHVLNVDEIGPQSIRIDMQGNIHLALVGRMHAGDLTIEQLENAIGNQLKSYLLSPTVSVTIMEYHSQPISILGAVSRPGVHQLQGHKNLFEALSLAEGLRTDAGGEIRITRRKEWGPIPLKDAVNDPSGEYSVATVSVKSIMEATDPQENIEMKPNDVVSVPKAKMVYVVGSVRRPGGFVLSEKETLSVLQAVSLAEGLERTAASKKAVILRSATATAQRREVPIDVSRILSGKSSDMPLQANDILFIPNNMAKSIALRTSEALIQAGTGMAIYH
jgi:polysaccharide export outer membrane protein